MPNKQTHYEHVERLYKEAQDESSKLYRSVREDLLTGSVKMGKLVRNNPGISEAQIEEAVQDVFLTLLKMPYPWTFEGEEFYDPRAGELIKVKEATLRVLSERRARMNRLTVEATLDHFRLSSANTITMDEDGDEREVIDLFTEDDHLDIYSTRLAPPEPDHKNCVDYRKVTTIKAKCHPAEGHYSKGWCTKCYFALTRHNKGVVRPFRINSKIPVVKDKAKLHITPRLLTKAFTLRLERSVTRAPQVRIQQDPQPRYAFRSDEFWREWFQTTPSGIPPHIYAQLYPKE